MLYRLVYLSSYIGIATEDSLRNIFETAAKNNVRDEITGFIIFYEGNFFQVMEGDADKVEACFSRIEKDRRHRMPTRLGVHSVEKREFTSWEALYYLMSADADGGASLNAALKTDGHNDENISRTVTGPQLREVNKARLREILLKAEDNSLSDDLSLNVFVKNFLYSFRDLR